MADSIFLPVLGNTAGGEESIQSSAESYGALICKLDERVARQLEQLVALGRSFFSHSDEEKEHYRASDPGDWTGYLGQKTTGPSGRGDDFERLAISPASTEGKAGTHISRLFADHPQLSDLLTENMDSMISICREANNSLSDMLKISKADSDHLWFSSHSSKLVLNYYPVSEPVPLAAHTDFGGLTLVYSGNNPSALEIEDPGTNTWHSVRNLSNETALITMGELYSYWVGQLWPPTVHRVASPYPGRISVILFHIPARDQYITPIRGRSPRVWADSFIANREHGYLIR